MPTKLDSYRISFDIRLPIDTQHSFVESSIRINLVKGVRELIKGCLKNKQNTTIDIAMIQNAVIVSSWKEEV